MKRYRKALLISAFISVSLLPAFTLYAQDKNTEDLKLSIQLRPRAEVRNGLFTPILKDQKTAAFVGQRSRLGLTYSRSPYLKLGLTTQVVNVWGNDAQVQTTANDLSLYEAWAQVFFSKEWSLKLGRQVLSYDDERILGALDWNNAGRKHDAALLGFEKNKLKANTGFAFNQNSEKTTGTFYDNLISQPYKSMEFLWLRYDINPTLAFSILGLNLGFQDRIDSSRSNLQTMGGNVFLKKNKWAATGTYYLQTGMNHKDNLVAKRTNAWMASLKVDYSFRPSFSTSIGSDYLSGNDMNSTSAKNTYFNPLYGTGHKFYGSMDYFYVSSPHNNAGLWDSYINFNFKPAEKFTTQIAYHHFESTGKLVDYTGENANKSLGNEIDLSLGYTIMNDVKLTGGYSQIFTDKSMRYVKNIPSVSEIKSLQNWVWVSININPQIILKSNQ